MADFEEHKELINRFVKRLRLWGAVLVLPYWLSISLSLLDTAKSAEFYMLLVFPLAIIMGSLTSHFAGYWILANKYSKQFAKEVIWNSYWPIQEDE